jgi:hypothetical protein
LPIADCRLPIADVPIANCQFTDCGFAALFITAPIADDNLFLLERQSAIGNRQSSWLC